MGDVNSFERTPPFHAVRAKKILWNIWLFAPKSVTVYNCNKNKFGYIGKIH